MLGEEGGEGSYAVIVESFLIALLSNASSSSSTPDDTAVTLLMRREIVETCPDIDSKTSVRFPTGPVGRSTLTVGISLTSTASETSESIANSFSIRDTSRSTNDVDEGSGGGIFVTTFSSVVSFSSCFSPSFSCSTFCFFCATSSASANPIFWIALANPPDKSIMLPLGMAGEPSCTITFGPPIFAFLLASSSISTSSISTLDGLAILAGVGWRVDSMTLRCSRTCSAADAIFIPSTESVETFTEESGAALLSWFSNLSLNVFACWARSFIVDFITSS
mmetsp:Transcript_8257/g.16661  ORF Transcript_8257/g.16661 Transcript_8257/m.16661 type:complete len:278 (+) Transcript_8257:1336-2169(+)